MNYISETDSPISAFGGVKAASVSVEELLRVCGKPPDSAVEERDFSEFFDRLSVIREWFSDERRAAAGRFSLLRKLMEQNLRDLKVFAVGRVEIELYVVGIDAEGNLTGITARAVET